MLNIDSVSIKVKKGYLVLKTGMVIEDPIAKIPLELVPKIEWDSTVKTAIIQELIKKGELKTVLAMAGHKDSKKKDSNDEKPAGWEKD